MPRLGRSGCLVSVVMIGVMACSQPEGNKQNSDGPIRSQITYINGATIGVKDPSVSFWVFDITLHNDGDQPVVLDRAALRPAPEVVTPVLVRAAIVGPDRHVGGGPPSIVGGTLAPLKGYRVEPLSNLVGIQRGLSYLLELRLRAGDTPRSFNALHCGVQVYYHDDEGRRYVANFNMQYVVCLSLRTCDPPYRS